MKFYITTFFLIPFGINTIYQNTNSEDGIKAGIHLSNMKWSISDIDFNWKVGYFIGAYSKKNFNKKIAIKPELFYSAHRMGTEIYYQESEEDFPVADKINILNYKVQLQ